MKTIQEVHAAINLDLQEINSNVFGNVSPQEIDMVLYQEILEFIRDNIEPLSNKLQQGFQQTGKRYDNIKDVITKAPVALYRNNDNSLYGTLPRDYFKYVACRSGIYNNCNTTEVTTTTQTVYVNTFKLKDDTTAPLYNSFSIFNDQGSEIFFDASDIDSSFSLNSAKEKFTLVSLILEDFNNQGLGLEIYWEWYNGQYEEGSFWLVGSSDYEIGIEYENSSLDETIVLAAETSARTVYSLDSVTTKNYPCRLVDSRDIEDRLESSFSTTFFNSPVIEIVEDKIFIYHSESFIPKSLELTYIRNPRVTNLSLQRNTDLKGSVLDLIARKTAERLAVIKNNSNAPIITQHNFNNE